jgi:hypothetical protein
VVSTYDWCSILGNQQRAILSLLLQDSTCVQGIQHRLGHLWLYVIYSNALSSIGSQLSQPWAAQLQHQAVHSEALLRMLRVLHQQLQVRAATCAGTATEPLLDQ